MCERDRPRVRAFLANLGVDMPWRRKLALLLRNSLIKLTRLQACCDHPNEPGC